MTLPDRFIERMTGYFSTHYASEAGDFWRSFEEPVVHGIRLNRLKVPVEKDADVLSSIGTVIDPVPWCSSGYYVDDKVSGNDSYSHAGVFYQQEPSAMLPAEIIAVEPGEFVLDLCAAPGGKTTRIAEMLQGEGLLIANDISSDRCRALLRNLERMGIADAVILNETPERLADRFAGFFDKILIDAPCSGEGMFRRDPSAVKSWERYGVETTTKMQRDILIQADRMLAEGGSIVYSTCTFSEEENEKMAEWFLSECTGYELVVHTEVPSVSFSSVAGNPKGAMRIWPHRSRGEGHFCVHFHKNGVLRTRSEEEAKLQIVPGVELSTPRCVASFIDGLLNADAAARFLRTLKQSGYIAHDRLHFHRKPPALYRGLRAVKIGAYCGEIKNAATQPVFIPSSSLASALNVGDIRPERRLSFERADQRVERYLKGETIFTSVDEEKKLEDRAYIVIAVDDFPLGFAKHSDHALKNHYPKSWRVL
jgi:NOL1/NOP2/sun family putative RNA methylase